MFSRAGRGNKPQQEPLQGRFLLLTAGLRTLTSSLCFIYIRCSAVIVVVVVFFKKNLLVHVTVRWVYLFSGAVLRDSAHLKHRGLRWGCKLISLATRSNSG